MYSMNVLGQADYRYIHIHGYIGGYRSTTYFLMNAINGFLFTRSDMQCSSMECIAYNCYVNDSINYYHDFERKIVVSAFNQQLY